MSKLAGFSDFINDKRQVLVLSTGVPLTKRFQNIVSHNPLRPNYNLKIETSGHGGSYAGAKAAESTVAFGGLSFGSTSNDVNSKDAEIIRLRAQLRATQLRLDEAKAGGKGGIDKRLGFAMKSGTKFSINSRVGGGINVKGFGKGRSLALCNHNAVKLFTSKFSFDKDKDSGYGKSSLNGNGGKSNRGSKFVDKDDLDKELDAYMSKAKPKKRIIINKSLSEHVAEANKEIVSTASEADTKAVETTPHTTWVEASLTPPYVEDMDGEQGKEESDLYEDMLIA